MAEGFEKVRVKLEDYAYEGSVVAALTKTSGAIRYVVEDSNGRLFIHNAKQIGKPDGWWPE